MIFHRQAPVFPLNLFIESFIYYKDFNPAHSMDRFLPDGNINIVFDLTDYPKYIYDNETLKEIQACRNVWFSGIRNKYITIPSGKDSEMFIINFQKGKAYPFVQMPMNELTDCVVDGDLVLTDEIMNLREMLLSVQNINQKFTAAENFLLKHFGKNLAQNSMIDYAVAQIVDMPNQIAMNKLSGDIGCSQKHFIKLFKEKVGLSPKEFLKIIRFQKAINEIETRKAISWTSIAFDCGFYDQAHFIHDFKHFSGFTPQEYLQSKNNQLNYVPIG